MQPTTRCNINCSYCYLPDRQNNAKMPVSVSQKLAVELPLLALGYPIDIIWHGGEPLACGKKHFGDLLSPFRDLTEDNIVSHAIQTNGTIIDDAWCELFQGYKVRVGISLDGPKHLNSRRVDWKGGETFDKALRGAKMLNEHGVDFIVLVVINSDNIEYPEEIYDFFASSGCSGIGINIEETEGVNKASINNNAQVKEFWTRLFKRWFDNPVIRIREFSKMLYSIEEQLDGKEVRVASMSYDIFPTVCHNGDVVLLSPELIGGTSVAYPSFVVGNVLETELTAILQSGSVQDYVKHYLQGVKKCMASCNYFWHCKGGQASNKFYETGRIDSTETRYCINAKQLLFDAITEHIALQQ